MFNRKTRIILMLIAVLIALFGVPLTASRMNKDIGGFAVDLLEE